jgi:hypothetical protein
MTEVYKAMQALGCVWHQVNNYRVICLWRNAESVRSFDMQQQQLQQQVSSFDVTSPITANAATIHQYYSQELLLLT